MEYTEVVSYFKGIASKLKSIQHNDIHQKRFISDFNDEMAQKWGDMKGYFMVLSGGAGKFVEQGMYYKDSKRMAVEIHGHCDHMESVELKEQVRSKIEAIAKQVIVRMIEDSENYDTCPHFLQKFNPSSAIYEHFESAVPNFLTCVLSFDLISDDYIEIDENEWLQ